MIGEWHNSATIVPPFQARFVDNRLALALKDQAGAILPGSHCSLNRRDNLGYDPALTDVAAETSELDGKWLFGGFFQPHFGHQITQCLGRLPWLQEAGEVDGILLAGFSRALRRKGKQAMLRRTYAAFGVTLPVQLIVAPTRIEKLFVGESLFGETTQCRPDPAFVVWCRNNIVTQGIQPTPGSKLYVTRTQLEPALGHVLCEDVLEDNLRQSGFKIFAPEQHDLETQLKTYAAAETIVMTDGSAAHLTAFPLHPQQQLTVLARRDKPPVLIHNHLQGFASEEGGVRNLTFANAVVREWPGPVGSNIRERGELDFVQIRDLLVTNGAIDSQHAAAWKIPTSAQLAAAKLRGLPEEAVESAPFPNP